MRNVTARGLFLRLTFLRHKAQTHSELGHRGPLVQCPRGPNIRYCRCVGAIFVELRWSMLVVFDGRL
jgi:hypothetical protein